MAHFPDVSDRVASIPTSPYSAIAAKVKARGGPVYPLHIGDTWLEPPPGCHMQDLETDAFDGLHRYTSIHGWPPLLERIAARVAQRSGVATAADHVLITPGATQGLGTLMNTLISPGDEVLILAPYWPLIAGLVRVAGGVPIEVPTTAASAEQVRAELAAARSPRCIAVYFNSPNNPTGTCYAPDIIEAIASFAQEHDLWIVADEVYEDYVYDGTHTYARTLAPERTIAAHSFSKAYGMAGNRVGYLVAPQTLISQAVKMGLHSIYCTPMASQAAAARALEHGDDWLATTSARYAEIGQAAAKRLGLPAPQGSTFLWLDTSAHLDERGLPGLLDDLGEHGVLVAPGPSFGPFPHHVRICFTATAPEITLAGIEAIATVLGLG